MRGTNDAWQNVSSGNLRILDKNGGLNNTSTYIGFAPQRKLGVVILVNRGKQHATGIGRQILHALARDQTQASTEGEPGIDLLAGAEKMVSRLSSVHRLPRLTASTGVFRCGRLQQPRGLHQSRVAAALCVFRGRYSCW